MKRAIGLTIAAAKDLCEGCKFQPDTESCPSGNCAGVIYVDHRDQATLCALRDLIGYVECGEGCKVSIVQDDATRWWTLTVGEKSYYGESFESVIMDTDAKYRQNPHYQALRRVTE